MRIVRSAAPVRICDTGGWTDTWFAGHGRVFSIAVRPRVDVEVRLAESGGGTYRVEVENFADAFDWREGAPGGRHPLVEAVLAAAGLPGDRDGRIAIRSDMPAGASTGTSAAVAVALAGALAAIAGRRLTRHEVAAAAHEIETRRLGWQSGVQDHLAAAYGGVNLIEIDAYPAARVRRLTLPPGLEAELGRRLLLVYLGHAHESSRVHEAVIRGLEDRGPGAPPLVALREAARASAEAVEAGDLDALGRAMVANTAAQQDLHPDLVGADASRVIAAAAACGAAGWKVNGAGGAGGSVTVLAPADAAAGRACAGAIAAAGARFQVIPVALDRTGLCVWDATAPDRAAPALPDL